MFKCWFRLSHSDEFMSLHRRRRHYFCVTPCFVLIYSRFSNSWFIALFDRNCKTFIKHTINTNIWQAVKQQLSVSARVTMPSEPRKRRKSRTSTWSPRLHHVCLPPSSGTENEEKLNFPRNFSRLNIYSNRGVKSNFSALFSLFPNRARQIQISEARSNVDAIRWKEGNSRSSAGINVIKSRTSAFNWICRGQLMGQRWFISRFVVYHWLVRPTASANE